MDVSQVVHSLLPSSQLSASCVFRAALTLSWKVQLQFDVFYVCVNIMQLLSADINDVYFKTVAGSLSGPWLEPRRQRGQSRVHQRPLQPPPHVSCSPPAVTTSSVTIPSAAPASSLSLDASCITCSWWAALPRASLSAQTSPWLHGQSRSVRLSCSV